MHDGQTAPRAKFFRPVLAGWMIAWMLFSSLLAASPALHERLHENAAQASHQCAITLVEQQQILSGEPHIFVFVVDSPITETVVPPTRSIVSRIDVQLLPGRAPPACS